MVAELKRKGDRVMCGDKDWGAAYDNGDALVCCGCILTVGRNATVCDDCSCHDTWRMYSRIT